MLDPDGRFRPVTGDYGSAFSFRVMVVPVEGKIFYAKQAMAAETRNAPSASPKKGPAH